MIARTLHNFFGLSAGMVAMVAAFAGCTTEEIETTFRHLDRPSPLALVTRGDATYGFVANTSRGDVALFSATPPEHSLFDLGLIDLIDNQPGFGLLPVGSLPSDMQTTADGCQIVVANAASCDVSLIDADRVLGDVEAGRPVLGDDPPTLRVPLVNSAGDPFLASPQNVVIVPSSVPSSAEPGPADPDCGALGENADGDGYAAYVTFPRCNMLARVVFERDGQTLIGRVEEALVFTAGGVTYTATPTCEAECTARGADVPVSGSAAPGVLPWGLALHQDATWIYVSSAGIGRIWEVPLTASSGAFRGDVAVATRGIGLEGEHAGTTRIALSPEPANSRLGQFLYAVALDGTVRVVALDTDFASAGRECETNRDLFQSLDSRSISTVRCLERGEQRQVTADSPGFEFPGRIATDVAFMKTRAEGETADDIFGLISTSEGTIWLVNIEDHLLIPPNASSVVDDFAIPHRIRNIAEDDASGDPPVFVEEISATSGGVPVVTTVASGAAQVDDICLRAPGEDLASDQFMRYEPLLLSRQRGRIEVRDGVLRLVDPGADFCVLGISGRYNDMDLVTADPDDYEASIAQGRYVHHGDIVRLVGCADSGDCLPHERCQKSVAQQNRNGLCIPEDASDELVLSCQPYLASTREFLVREARNGELILDLLPTAPERLYRQPGNVTCDDNADCDPHFLCALAPIRVNDGSDDGVVIIDEGECFRAGCESSADCPVGQFCLEAIDGPPAVCAPAPLPGTTTEVGACFRTVQRYDVYAGRSLVLLGARRASIDVESGKCALNRDESPLLTERIPISIPALPVLVGFPCLDASFDEISVDPCGNGPWPTALGCLAFENKSYNGYTELPGGILTGEQPAPTLQAHVATSQMGFSVGLSHLFPQILAAPLEPSSEEWSTADQILFAEGDLFSTMPERGLTYSLVVTDRFTPATVTDSATVLSFPGRLVVGSDGNVYVVDTGDTSGTAGVRGQVVRFDSTALEFDLEFSIF